MKKTKLLAAFLAAALCAPQAAFAARDGEGMEYTSAAEGFYGSIRSVYSTNTGAKDNGSRIAADGSRLGVRGSLDLGHGLSGLYRYEWSIASQNGEAPGNTRLGYVGLRGGFGEFVAGSHWENDYNWVTAGTDIASTGSGNFAPHFRRKNSFQYTTPEAGGFQASFRIGMNGGSKNAGDDITENVTLSFTRDDTNDTSVEVRVGGFGSGDAVTTVTFTDLQTQVIPNLPEGLRASASVAFPALTTLSSPITFTGATTGSDTIDEWALAAKYSTHGFTFGAAYEVLPDGRGYVVPPLVAAELARSADRLITSAVNPPVVEASRTLTPVDEDHNFWAIRAGYSHANWGVNSWYGKHNTAKRGTPASIFGADAVVQDAARMRNFQPQDTTVFSVAGNVDFGKFALVGIYEQRENEWAMEDNVFVANLDYKFTSRSKAYFAFITNDFQTAPDKDDEVRIGLRMDF